MRKPFSGDYPITQTWGNKFINNGVDVYAQWGLKGHNGIDFGLPSGTRVLAPHAGTVLEVNYDSAGYGNYVKIESETEGSVLAHLDDVKVQVGFVVAEGDFIGTSDNTGYSTGAHLHWGYYKKPRNRQDGYNGFIDQMPFISNTAPVTVTPAVPAKVYTEEEYMKVVGERDEALRQSQLSHDNYILVQGLYSGFQALGYNKPDDITQKLAEYDKVKELYAGFVALGYGSPQDITAKLKDYDDKFIGLNTQILTTLKRNQELTQILHDKENEDSTAIEEGIKALTQLNEAKEHITKISKVVGSKPNLYDIVRHLFNFKANAEEAVKKAKKEAAEGIKKAQEDIKEEPAPGVPVKIEIREPQEKYGLDWIMGILKLKGGDK